MKRVAIVGLGLIGGSLGMALKASAGDVEVLGVARRADTARRARELGAVDAAGTDLAAVATADVVVVACPLQATREVLDGCAPHLSGSALVTDVGSVKSSVVEHAARALDPAVHLFVGGHPMAGKEVSGIENADPALFRGRPWLFTPLDGIVPDDRRVKEWASMVRAVGADPVLFMAPDRHDRLVALVSHMPFLLSAAYLLAVGGDPEWGDAARLASSGFRDFTRIGAGEPEMYAAITEANRDAILAAVAELHATLAELEIGAAGADGDRLRELFDAARTTRQEWAERHPT